MTRTKKPLVIIDTSCVLYKALDLTRDKVTKEVVNKVNNKIRDERLSQAVKLYNTLYFLPQIAAKKAEIIWVGDSKPYWRNQFVDDMILENPETVMKTEGQRKGYKGNRNTCPYQVQCANSLYRKASPLVFNGYEADDIAAAICQIYPNREIYLLTVDSDWLQLLTSKVKWVCMTGFSPPIRTVNNLQDWFSNKLKVARKSTRDLIDPTSPTDISKWKQLTGDTADNLPAGSPIELFDLKNPPENHKLWLKRGFKTRVKEKIQPVDPHPEIYYDWIIKNDGSTPTPIYQKIPT